MVSQTRIGFGYPKRVCFRCTRCALCCGDTKSRTRRILLLMEDARKISGGVLKPVEAFAILTRSSEPYVYEMRKTRGEGKCLFLEGADCSIYAVRPLVCRFYPFELATLKNGKPCFSGTKECPGIGRGKRLERKYFESLLKRAHNQLKR
jgi:Fe-S-cluster containining protein